MIYLHVVINIHSYVSVLTVNSSVVVIEIDDVVVVVINYQIEYFLIL